MSEYSVDARPKTAKLLHSGYALAHHDSANLIVENNTVRNAFRIKIGSEKSFPPREPGSKSQTPKLKGHSPQMESNFDNVLSHPTSSSNQVINLHNYLQKTYDKKSDKLNRKSSYVHYSEASSPGSERITPQASMAADSGVLQKNKAEIARMLYPDLPRNAIKEEDLWVNKASLIA